MMQPKRTKFRKQFKGNLAGTSHRGSTVAFGEFGLKAMSRARMTSREIETIVGRIMIARITPAANSPTPKVGPARNGTQPKVSLTQASTVSFRKGERTNTPHRP